MMHRQHSPKKEIDFHMIALELKNLTFRHRENEPTLSQVNLVVKKGERIAILGASGAGKSTLLRVIAGLEKVESGEVVISGRTMSSPAAHVKPEERKVGMVFQDWAVFPHLTVFQNIAFGLPNRGKTSEERDRVLTLLQKFELEGLETRSPSSLSGGQLQRVACARSLAPQPEILLFDEAFSSLDVGLRHRVRQQVVEALESERTTSLLVTHDPSEAAQFAQRIFQLFEHNLIEIESSEWAKNGFPR
jgi:iron(III) transport system ATP-binding protein